MLADGIQDLVADVEHDLAARLRTVVRDVRDIIDESDPKDTWEDTQRGRHLMTAHTPLSRVGEVAAAAEARRLVLTHFVPGDDALPDEHWTGGVAGFEGEVIVGSDGLEVRP